MDFFTDKFIKLLDRLSVVLEVLKFILYAIALAAIIVAVGMLLTSILLVCAIKIQ